MPMMRYVRLEKYATGKHGMLVMLKDVFNVIPSCKYTYESKHVIFFLIYLLCK